MTCKDFIYCNPRCGAVAQRLFDCVGGSFIMSLSVFMLYFSITSNFIWLVFLTSLMSSIMKHLSLRFHVLCLPQPPYNLPVPECVVQGMSFFPAEQAVPDWFQDMPWDCPLLVWPCYWSQRLDRGVDQWRLCYFPGGYYLGPGTTSIVPSSTVALVMSYVLFSIDVFYASCSQKNILSNMLYSNKLNLQYQIKVTFYLKECFICSSLGFFYSEKLAVLLNDLLSIMLILKDKADLIKRAAPLVFAHFFYK